MLSLHQFCIKLNTSLVALTATRVAGMRNARKAKIFSHLPSALQHSVFSQRLAKYR